MKFNVHKLHGESGVTMKVWMFSSRLAAIALSILMLFCVTLSAHAQNTGSIRGAVFEDVDGDKIQSDEEPGLPTRFVITSPATGHIEVATNENGAFLLTGLPEGTYTVVPPHINGYALFGGETGFVSNYNVLPNKQTLVAMPFQHFCAEFVIKEVKCNVSSSGVFSGYSVTFDYTNVGSLWSRNSCSLLRLV